MIDPLADIVTLLHPSARFSKMVTAAGSWRVVRSGVGQPFYAVVLEGQCNMILSGGDPVALQAGDFVLVPAAFDFVMSSVDRPPVDLESQPIMLAPGKARVGRQEGPAELCALIGHCHFGSPDAALLVSLLPQLVHVRDAPRLATLVGLVDDEARAERPARDVVLSRLLEAMFIEALRMAASNEALSGLVRGLADARIACAIRAMHEHPSHVWTVAELAEVAALSRSAFFGRFKQKVGVAPMAYLLAWRMALAKQWLRQDQRRIAEIAECIGYRSASAFSVAFTRCVGQSPAQYGRGGGTEASSSSTADGLLASEQ